MNNSVKDCSVNSKKQKKTDKTDTIVYVQMITSLSSAEWEKIKSLISLQCSRLGEYCSLSNIRY